MVRPRPVSPVAPPLAGSPVMAQRWADLVSCTRFGRPAPATGLP